MPQSERVEFKLGHYRFIRRLFEGDSMAELCYPTHEQLESIGLTGKEFHSRYIVPIRFSPYESPRHYSQRVLGRFWKDYPQLRPKQ